MLGHGIIRAYFLVLPVPDIIEEAPNYVFISINHLILSPKISRAKFRKFFEIIQDLLEIDLNLCQIAFLRISRNAFDNLLFATQPIDQIRKHNPRLTILWEIAHQLLVLRLIHRLDQPNLVN